MNTNYIVYRDSSGEFGAVPDQYSNDQKIDLWMEGKTVFGNPSARNETDAIDYVETILRSRGQL